MLTENEIRTTCGWIDPELAGTYSFSEAEKMRCSLPAKGERFYAPDSMDYFFCTNHLAEFDRMMETENA